MKGYVPAHEVSLRPSAKFDLADLHTDSRMTLQAALSTRAVWLTPLEVTWHATLVMIPTTLMIYALSLCSAVRTTMLYALVVARTLAAYGTSVSLWPLTEPLGDVTRTRILWHLVSFPPVQGMVASALFYIFIKYDPHWEYIDHQMFLHMVLFLLSNLAQQASDHCAHPNSFRKDPDSGQPPNCGKQLRERLQKLCSYAVANSILALILLLASVLRYYLLHDWAKNSQLRLLVIGGGLLVQIVLSKGLPIVMFVIMPKPADDETPLRLARMRETFSFYCAYYSLFATKLLVTALQGPVEAWCFSFMSAVLEVADTLYGFYSDTSKLSRLRAELRSTDLTEAEASVNEEKKAAEITALRETVVLRAMRYLSMMMLEYVATATAVLLAVTFEGDKLVTGLSAGYWTVRTGLSFLLAQFVPELMSDVVGLAIVTMFGVRFRELFEAVHSSVFILAPKAVTGPYILPLVIICALERKWGI